MLQAGLRVPGARVYLPKSVCLQATALYSVSMQFSLHTYFDSDDSDLFLRRMFAG